MDVAEDVDPFGEVGMIGYFPNAGGEVTPPAVGLGEATPPYQPVCRVQTPPPSPLPVMAGEVVHPVDAAPSLETELVTAIGLAIEADRVVAPAAADEVAIPVAHADDAHAEPPRPSWLVGIPDRLLNSGNPVEDAFRGMSELQVQVCLKYGHEHIKSVVSVDSVLSIRRKRGRGSIQTIRRKPQTCNIHDASTIFGSSRGCRGGK